MEPDLEPLHPFLRARLDFRAVFNQLHTSECNVRQQERELQQRKDALLVELGVVTESLESLYGCRKSLQATRETMIAELQDCPLAVALDKDLLV